MRLSVCYGQAKWRLSQLLLFAGRIDTLLMRGRIVSLTMEGVLFQSVLAWVVYRYQYFQILFAHFEPQNVTDSFDCQISRHELLSDPLRLIYSGAGTNTGAPLSLIKKTTNFAGLVLLAFLPTT